MAAFVRKQSLAAAAWARCDDCFGQRAAMSQARGSLLVPGDTASGSARRTAVYVAAAWHGKRRWSDDRSRVLDEHGAKVVRSLPVWNAPVDFDAFDAFEAVSWEEKAAAYERFFGVIAGRVVEPLLAAASVGVGARVLDVATGPGWVAAQAAELGASVVGVDVAEAMIARARSAHPQLDFRRADAHELPFADASFDAVVGNFAIMHLSRPERAVAQCARVLRPGGRLALTAWADPSEHRLVGVLLDAVAEARAMPPADLPRSPDFFRFSDDEEFAAALRQQDLADPVVTGITFMHRCASADELWDGMLGATVRASALITRQPQDARQRIRAAFDRLASGYRRGDVLEMPVAVKLATARKPDPR